jgi:hypothetical protein
MSINLLELVKDQVSDPLVTQASSFLGESEGGIQSALGGIMPTLLGSLISEAFKPEGGNGIMDIIGKLDLGSLSNVADIFKGGESAVNGLMNNGGGIVESLLGSKSSSVIDLISKVSGLKSGSTSSLLKMAAPLLMGVIGNQANGKGLEFLNDLLKEQKDHVAKALPAGMGSLLGMADMFVGAKESVQASVSSAAGTAKKVAGADSTTSPSEGGSNNLLKWLLPLLVGAGAIWFVSQKGCGKTVEETGTSLTDAAVDAAASAADVTANAANAIGDMLKSVFSQVDSVSKKAYDALTVEVGSAPDQINSYINGGFSGDPMFTIKNVNFVSGSAELSKEGQA